ncbi:MAG: ATP-binding protein [Magnetococcus sp. DMHC-1]|nr:ATP-binding protein [Magnetococcales bacterium]
MARSDLLLDLVRSGTRGDQALFRKTLEAIISEERSRQHHVLANRLAAYLGHGPGNIPASSGTLQPWRANGGGSDFLFETTPNRQLEDLILADTSLAACRELIDEQQRADLLRAHNLEPRHRVLLAGPPGNGKTSLAEALAYELSIPLLVVRYDAVITSFLGETSSRLARLFDYVRTRHCVLFLDEFDVLGKERGDVHETGEIKRVVSSLLLQVDALPSHVVVVTATNHPELLDRAVWRRFQLRLHLDHPTRAQAEKWFQRFADRFEQKLGYTPGLLAEKLSGVSFSELEQFGLDIQRRYILSIPNDNLKQIVTERLAQWHNRFSMNCHASTPAKVFNDPTPASSPAGSRKSNRTQKKEGRFREDGPSVLPEASSQTCTPFPGTPKSV